MPGRAAAPGDRAVQNGLRDRRARCRRAVLRPRAGAKPLSGGVPPACLLDLSASVSKSPAELVPVRPVLELAKDKPLELLSGTNLLCLLKVHAGVDAKIEPPEHWVEPAADTGPAHWDEPRDA